MDAAVQGLRYLSDRDMIATTKRDPVPPSPRDTRPKVNPYGT